jgi:hypothetical protein
MSRCSDAGWEIPFCNLLGAVKENQMATEDFFL